MLTGVTTRSMQVCGVVISSVAGDFQFEVNEKELLILEKPSLQPANRREISPQGSKDG